MGEEKTRMRHMAYEASRMRRFRHALPRGRLVAAHGRVGYSGRYRNTVRLAVRAELVEAHSPFDRLRANGLKRTALGRYR